MNIVASTIDVAPTGGDGLSCAVVHTQRERSVGHVIDLERPVRRAFAGQHEIADACFDACLGETSRPEHRTRVRRITYLDSTVHRVGRQRYATTVR